MKLNDIFEILLIESKTDDIIKNKIKDMVSVGLDEDESDLISFVTNYGEKYVKSIKNPHKSLNKFFDEVIDYYYQESVSYKTAFQMVYPIFQDFFKYKEEGIIKDDFQQMSYNDMKSKVYEVELSKKRKELEGNVDKVYDDNRWLVLRINNKESSCKYGSDTRWCISATKGENRYTGYGYSENNFIYFVIDKKEKLDPDDVLYKMAILVNKKTKLIEVWDAKDDKLKPNQESIVKRFIPDIFEAISKDSKIAMDEITEDYIKFVLNDDYSLKNIKDYRRTGLKYNTDYSMLELKFQFGESRHFVDVIVDVKNNNISATFYRYELINNEETGERYYSFTPTSIISKVSNERITKSNFVKLIKGLVIDLLNSPEVKKYFIDNPKEYFSNVNLYKDIETMGNRKVPQAAFVTAIKLLKEKGDQNITAIRRIVDPKLQSSHNVKPLLRSLYSFGLIKLEKRGRNVIVVPTPKLVKTPLDKLI